METLWSAMLVPILVLILIVIIVPFIIMVSIIQVNFRLRKIHEALMAMMTKEQMDILLKDLDLNSS